MPGILYVVATPIGNLEDVTLRALRVLREVSLIAAEDTRRTAKLLQHYSISTRTTSLHEHNESARVPYLIGRLEQGHSIALVSDAGTPAVSDPGARLVSAAHAAGLPVQPVPGPSAVTAMVSASGVPGTAFLFAGFAPARSSHRKNWLADLADEDRPVVFYEAPHRIGRTLQEIRAVLGERRVAIGRELTKIHEELAVRPISGWLEKPPPSQGEFVLVLFPAEGGKARPESVPTPRDIAAEFGRTAEKMRGSKREIMRSVAARLGVSVRQVFQALELAKEQANDQ